MPSRLVSQHTRSQCQVSVARRWQCDTHQCWLQIASQMLHKGSKEMEVTGPILPTGFVTGYGVMAGRLWTTLHTGPIACPTISIYLDPVRITCLASNLKQITMWSKLSPPGCRCLTLPSAMLEDKPWCHCVTNASKSVSWWRSHVPCLHWSENKVLDTTVYVCVTLLFDLLCMYHSLIPSNEGLMSK